MSEKALITNENVDGNYRPFTIKNELNSLNLVTHPYFINKNYHLSQQRQQAYTN